MIVPEPLLNLQTVAVPQFRRLKIPPCLGEHAQLMIRARDATFVPYLLSSTLMQHCLSTFFVSSRDTPSGSFLTASRVCFWGCLGAFGFL